MEINAQVEVLSTGLDVERKERRAADTETREITDKQNKKSNRNALIAIIVAVICAVIALVSLLFTIAGYRRINVNEVPYSQPYSKTGQHDSDQGD